jgi:hypothetical protein
MRNAGPHATSALAGEARLRMQQRYVSLCDMQSALTPYLTEVEQRERMLQLKSFAALHGE